MLEEYGHYGKPPERDEAFSRWYKLLEELQVDGTMDWMMTEKGHDNGHPGFTHLGSTAAVLEQHAARIHKK